MCFAWKDKMGSDTSTLHIAKPFFVDVEGTKEVKRMINLLAITVNLYHEIDADPSGSGSKTDRVRK